MECWNWTICYMMSYSNGGKHAWVRGNKRSHATLKCCWKENLLLPTRVNASKKKGHWSTINLATMIEATRAQFNKWTIGAMVTINMNMMPLKVIRREAYLWARSPYGLSKDLGPKRCPNIWRKEKSKEIRDSMKVEDGSVHLNKYDGCCTKQWIKTPRVTWTSPILRKMFTY